MKLNVFLGLLDNIIELFYLVFLSLGFQFLQNKEQASQYCLQKYDWQMNKPLTWNHEFTNSRI